MNHSITAVATSTGGIAIASGGNIHLSGEVAEQVEESSARVDATGAGGVAISSEGNLHVIANATSAGGIALASGSSVHLNTVFEF